LWFSTPAEERRLYYITMELVEGKSLQAMLDAGQAFPLPRTLRINGADLQRATIRARAQRGARGHQAPPT